MPEVEGLDASTGTSKHKKRKRPDPVVVGPGGRSPGGSYGTSAGSSSSKNRPGKGGGGKGGDSISAAEARAVAREDAAKRKAGNRYLEQAANLEAQAKALQHALRKDFKRGLRQQLSDITQVMRQQDAILMDGYGERVGSLRGAARDNEKAEAGQSNINTTNQIRERNSAVGEAMAQGAGESDVLAAQMMSLRNWQANQTEVQRGYFDTLRTVNSSLRDLNVDTKTARANNQLQALADKEQLWTNYYDQRSETLTQLGNIRGQQADYYAMAKEMGVEAKNDKAKGGKGKKGKGGGYLTADTAGEARNQMERAFMGASKTKGRSWDNPGISPGIRRWEGSDDIAATSNASKLQMAQVTRLDKKPEGATLRKW